MSTITKGKAVYAGSLYDAGAPLLDCIEAASQSFKKGELVQINASSGKAELPTVVATDLLDISTVIAAGNSARIVGIAVKDASGVTNAPIQVQVVRPGDLLEMTLVQGTASPGTDHVSAQADFGCTVGLLRNSTAKEWYATTDITEPCGKVYRLGIGGGRGVIGDTNIRALILLTPSMLHAAPYTEIT